MIRTVKINRNERGLVFERGALVRVLADGLHWMWDPLLRARVERVSLRQPWLEHEDLEAIAKSGLLEGQAEVIDVLDDQRVLAWVDGRFARVLGPGVHVVWTAAHDIRTEVVDATEPRFAHRQLAAILAKDGGEHLNEVLVPAGHAALVYAEGSLLARLGPGRYATWKGLARVVVHLLDLREQMLEVPSQEIMTQDKVTVRMTAVLRYRVADPVRAKEAVDEYLAALYRSAQLALRAVVGTRPLDTILADKDGVAKLLQEAVEAGARAFGVQIAELGIRDLILPGEMKALMNRVTEAKQSAEASLITRREETAAMRSQANTAKILEANPTLMRLRELEVLEKIAEKTDLTVVLGDGKLSDRMTKMI